MAKKKEEGELEIITVKAGQSPDGKNRVALWEQHEAHPHEEGEAVGEVFVAGDKPVQVARTPEVEARLRSGVLVEASKEEIKDAAKETAKETKPPEKTK